MPSPPAAHHDDLVGTLHGGKSMCDHNHGLTCYELLKRRPIKRG